jgi:MoxR-like ATPase
MPADISGTTIVVEVDRRDAAGALLGKGREFTFQPGPVFAQIVLADEVNRATPKTQAAMLEAMAERNVTVGGRTHPLPRPFLVLATQNPLEQEGTYPLPEAQLDRFFFKLLVGYSSREELNHILDRTTTGAAADISPVLDADRILAYQALVQRAVIAPHVQDYAVRMVLATHPKPASPSAGSSQGELATPMVNRFVRFGASPRAAQALVLAAKCRALIDGRAAASVDDIRAVAAAAVRHRLILNFEAQAEAITADAIIENLVATLPVASPG